MKEMLLAKEAKLKKEGKCSICGTKVDIGSFRDTQSRCEFEISGMCQDCQDSVFEVEVGWR